MKTVYDIHNTKLENFDFNQNVIHSKKSNIVWYDMKKYEDKEYIANNIDYIQTILDEAYAQLGGYKGCINKKHLLKNSALVKIAYFNNAFIAISVYTNYLKGYKCIGLASVQGPLHDYGKNAVIEIIKEDIKNWNGWFWAEVSDKIKYYYSKFDGIAVPAEYRNLFLKPTLETNQIDEYTYEKTVFDADGDEIKLKKSIYGFNCIETFEEIVNNIKHKALHESSISYWENDNILNKAMDNLVYFADSYEYNYTDWPLEDFDLIKLNMKYVSDYLATHEPLEKSRYQLILNMAQDFVPYVNVLRVNKLYIDANDNIRSKEIKNWKILL